MKNSILSFEYDSLDQLQKIDSNESTNGLESGRVLYFPKLAYQISELNEELLTDKLLKGAHKNVSYDYRRDKLGKFSPIPGKEDLNEQLHQFMKEYALHAKKLVDTILPDYSNAIKWGRTSYRPAKTEGRKTSKRKDDTRLHVDAFPGSPVYGYRILRVFSNINPFGLPRVWHIGEPFNKVLDRYGKTISQFSPLIAKCLTLIKATKRTRSAYDHYMIKMHDQMKKDDNYQNTVSKQRIEFPAQSTWMVFTDLVSHAAIAGQYLLEQTFYVPVDSMKNPDLSPLNQWEKLRGFKMQRPISQYGVNL